MRRLIVKLVVIMWLPRGVQLVSGGRRLLSTASSKTSILEEVCTVSGCRPVAARASCSARNCCTLFTNAGQRISGHHHSQSAEGAQRPLAHTGMQYTSRVVWPLFRVGRPVSAVSICNRTLPSLS
eukprot:scaffold5298_cov131-Isochrysis_galbana.AAC.8